MGIKSVSTVNCGSRRISCSPKAAQPAHAADHAVGGLVVADLVGVSYQLLPGPSFHPWAAQLRPLDSQAYRPPQKEDKNEPREVVTVSNWGNFGHIVCSWVRWCPCRYTCSRGSGSKVTDPNTRNADPDSHTTHTNVTHTYTCASDAESLAH
jgi:hypothetical protein